MPPFVGVLRRETTENKEEMHEYNCEKGINLQRDYFVNCYGRRDMHEHNTNRHKRERLNNAHNALHWLGIEFKSGFLLS